MCKHCQLSKSVNTQQNEQELYKATGMHLIIFAVHLQKHALVQVLAHSVSLSSGEIATH